ncbi:MAG TPA: gluconate 2-dehydrogenase subunit 3 family protein [Alphaproteobacteria bacterium]|nr:gluconate 2-dehydrogenase subunit 3 family protein [Alphaproteobacteria bacterium]
MSESSSAARGIRRRNLLASTAAAFFVIGADAALARTIKGGLPWAPDSVVPPRPVSPIGWHFFTDLEGAAVDAICDRLIPPDDGKPGGKQAGCAIFIDRQLSGSYGAAERFYMRPPFAQGQATQGTQSQYSPAEQYRRGLAALDRYCRDTLGGKGFVELPAVEQDKLLAAMEKGEAQFTSISSREFFELLLQNAMEGFFADPIYGGNRDMAGWKLIGFPGARYDYREFVGQHNKPFPLPPVALQGRPEWTPR